MREIPLLTLIPRQLLYDFNCEPDRLVLVQALLLMTFWYESPHEHRNAWHWADVAISQAFAAGLHHDPPAAASPRVARLRRRIWWSCFMRDRLISMAMRRPPRIRDSDIAIPVLEKADFTMEEQPAGGHIPNLMCSYASDRGKRDRLALLCVAKAELCRCLRYYAPFHFSVFAENGAGGAAADAELLATSAPDNDAEFSSCLQGLLTWYGSLPDTCRHHPAASRVGEDDDASVVVLHGAVLHMIFYAALVGLHRACLASMLNRPGASPFEVEMSKNRMQHAAAQISDAADDLHTAGLDHLLPPAGITVVVAAAVVHLLEVKGRIQVDRAKALEGYRRCLRALQSLQDMYVAADVAREAMEWGFLDDFPGLVEVLTASETEPPLWWSPTASSGEDGLTPPEGMLPDLAIDRFSALANLESEVGYSPTTELGAPPAGEDAWLEIPTDVFDAFDDFVATPCGEESACR